MHSHKLKFDILTVQGNPSVTLPLSRTNLQRLSGDKKQKEQAACRDPTL